jgi:hypothetical protein
MIVDPSKEPGEDKKSLDMFMKTAYTNNALKKFINVAVDAFDRKGTMKLSLDIKSGEPKGGSGNFSF